MALNSLKWKRTVRRARKRLVPKNTAPVKTTHKGVVVSYSAGVSLVITLEDGVTEMTAHLIQCGGTAYAPVANDVVRVENENGVMTVVGKYIL